MNFLAHYVIATRFLMPAEPLSAYVIGTALPDLLPLAADRVRLRPVQLEQTPARTEYEAALSAGVSVHLATDAAFHKTAAFAEAQTEVSRRLAETRFEGIRVRRFFAAHVLTELALDAVLLRSEPDIADQFYDAFDEIDFAVVTRWTEVVTGQSLPHLPVVLGRFARSQYLRHYTEDDGVATGFSNLCRRARQEPFEEENFMRLANVISAVTAYLPVYVPALFSETTAAIHAAQKEHLK